MKGFLSKRIALKVDCYRTGKYTVCRCICAHFSPEMLQAGVVKGLIMESSASSINMGPSSHRVFKPAKTQLSWCVATWFKGFQMIPMPSCLHGQEGLASISTYLGTFHAFSQKHRGPTCFLTSSKKQGIQSTIPTSLGDKAQHWAWVDSGLNPESLLHETLASECQGEHNEPICHLASHLWAEARFEPAVRRSVCLQALHLSDWAKVADSEHQTQD